MSVTSPLDKTHEGRHSAAIPAGDATSGPVLLSGQQDPHGAAQPDSDRSSPEPSLRGDHNLAESKGSYHYAYLDIDEHDILSECLQFEKSGHMKLTLRRDILCLPWPGQTWSDDVEFGLRGPSDVRIRLSVCQDSPSPYLRFKVLQPLMTTSRAPSDDHNREVEEGVGGGVEDDVQAEDHELKGEQVDEVADEEAVEEETDEAAAEEEDEIHQQGLDIPSEETFYDRLIQETIRDHPDEVATAYTTAVANCPAKGYQEFDTWHKALRKEVAILLAIADASRVHRVQLSYMAENEEFDNAAAQ
jgi:hypothetical protein